MALMEVKNELHNERINFKDKMSEIQASFSDELENNAKKIGNRGYKSLLGYSFVGMSSENTVGNTASFLCTATKRGLQNTTTLIERMGLSIEHEFVETN